MLPADSFKELTQVVNKVNRVDKVVQVNLKDRIKEGLQHLFLQITQQISNAGNVSCLTLPIVFKQQRTLLLLLAQIFLQDIAVPMLLQLVVLKLTILHGTVPIHIQTEHTPSMCAHLRRTTADRTKQSILLRQEIHKTLPSRICLKVKRASIKYKPNAELQWPNLMIQLELKLNTYNSSRIKSTKAGQLTDKE